MTRRKQPRASNGRWTAERITETTTKVTERVTVEHDDTEDLPAVAPVWTVAREPDDAPDPWKALEARLNRADPLHPDWAGPRDEHPVIFWRLIKHPPVKARWRAHLAFTVDETARAVACEMAPAMPSPAPLAIEAAPYPELAETTLAHEFTGPMWNTDLAEEILP